jgi:hypothetical protein
MKDWLGNDFGPGDTVLYAAQSGRSVTMVLAKVVSINELIYDEETYGFVRIDKTPSSVIASALRNKAERKTTVTVQPLKSSRWKQHGGHTRYIDTRTGKGINPWLDKHVASGGYRRDKLTGERVDDSNYSLRYGEYEYVTTVFKDYVMEIHDGPKPVTLMVTENIVKMP